MPHPDQRVLDHRSVLIVEDDVPQRQALEQVFLAAGLVPTGVGDGLEAFSLLRDRDYGAIVCDLRMPHLGGIGLYEQVEHQFPHMASRIVFVTGWLADPKVAAFLNKTGQPWFGKPYRVDDLIAVVQQMLDRVVG